MPLETKIIIKAFFKKTPFYPVHIGQYLRKIYFFKALRALPIESFCQALDAGCGSGIYTLKLAKRYPRMEVIGKDIKKSKGWRKSPPNVQFHQQDLHQISEKNYYDFCFSIDTLEHIPENAKVLKKIYNSLKTNGYFYLHMPSRHWQRILPKRFFREFEEWVKNEHIGKQYNLKEMKETLKSIGFKIVKAEHSFGFWGELAWELDRITDKKRVIKIILMPLLKILAQFDSWFPKDKGNGVLAICTK